MTTPARTEFEAAAYWWLRDKLLSGDSFDLDDFCPPGKKWRGIDFPSTGEVDTAIAAAMGWPTVPLAAAPEWQTIETAPKDGKRVLVWMDEKNMKGVALAKLWFYQDGTLGGGAEGFNGSGWNLTHWMPLPAAPQPTGTPGAGT